MLIFGATSWRLLYNFGCCDVCTRMSPKWFVFVASGFGCLFVVLDTNTFEFLRHLLAQVNNHPIHAQHLREE